MKKVLLTGASGCTGSYILESLLSSSEFEVIAWVRQKDRLLKHVLDQPNITIWEGGLEALDTYRKALKEIDVLIHPVTSWGGNDCFQVNLELTRALFLAMDPDQCQHIHYFSTASIIDTDFQVWNQVWTQGTDYIRSKATLHHWLQHSFSQIPVSIYFPSLILGGDHEHPKTPLSAFLPSLPDYLKWVRYLKARGSFHFIHAQDIAKILTYRIEHGLPAESLVLGNEALTVNGLMSELLTYYGLPQARFQLPLEKSFDYLLPLLARQMTSWDRFSLHIRETVYKHTNAATYGLHSDLDTFSKVLKKL